VLFLSNVVCVCVCVCVTDCMRIARVFLYFCVYICMCAYLKIRVCVFWYVGRALYLSIVCVYMCASEHVCLGVSVGPVQSGWWHDGLRAKQKGKPWLWMRG